MPAASSVHEFGLFRLDSAERLLLRDGQPVSLTPKAFDLLVYLVDHAGRLVTKQALMSALWPDSFVEESNLTFTVSALRKALGRRPGRRAVHSDRPDPGVPLRRPCHPRRDWAGPVHFRDAGSFFQASHSPSRDHRSGGCRRRHAARRRQTSARKDGCPSPREVHHSRAGVHTGHAARFPWRRSRRTADVWLSFRDQRVAHLAAQYRRFGCAAHRGYRRREVAVLGA